jgi:DNA polymerase III delta prime subunit
MICRNEDIKVESDKVLSELIKIADGDLRRSINTLQTCRSFAAGRTLRLEDIEKISGVVPDKVIA